MRLALFGGCALVAGTMTVAPARAAEWCIVNGSMGPGHSDCMYHTLEQCRASASGVGGFCDRNPRLPVKKATEQQIKPRNKKMQQQ